MLRTFAHFTALIGAAFCGVTLVASEVPQRYPTAKDKLNEIRSGALDKFVDVDADGQPDLRFEYDCTRIISCGFTPGIVTDEWDLRVKPLNGAAVQAASSLGILPVEQGKIIGADFGWRSESQRLLTITGYGSLWDRHWEGRFGEVTDGVFGVRLTREGRFYYGWVRVSCSRDTGRFEVRDFAVAPAPDTGIVAGYRVVEVHVQSN